MARGWLDAPPGAGIDGVVAKRPDLAYAPGRRAMVKVKRERTADCVVAGLRAFADGEPAVASLLLGLRDDAGALVHVGVASSFPQGDRRALLAALAPERVAEVASDRLDGLRFRHPARFVRWRPDRDPSSCGLDQLRGFG